MTEKIMQAVNLASVDELVALPPTIFGVIRWKKYIGRPAGHLCSGFNIRVEEHTATQFRALGGGKYEPIPGTGIWQDVNDSLVCRELPDEADYHKLSFQIWGRDIHLNAFPDGQYRITPTLTGLWTRATPVVLLGSRIIEPRSASVVLKKDDHIQSVVFEVAQRSRPWWTIFGAAIAGALVGSALRRANPSASYLVRSGSDR
jgi:hypothetical protein